MTDIITALREEIAALEASNRIRGDELARLREQEPVAHVDGNEVHRLIMWSKTVAAFNYPVGTPLYAAPPGSIWRCSGAAEPHAV